MIKGAHRRLIVEPHLAEACKVKSFALTECGSTVPVKNLALFIREQVGLPSPSSMANPFDMRRQDDA